MFQTNAVEEIKMHFIFNNFLFENLIIYDIMWKKFCRAGRAKDENMAPALCILHN